MAGGVEESKMSDSELKEKLLSNEIYENNPEQLETGNYSQQKQQQIQYNKLAEYMDTVKREQQQYLLQQQQQQQGKKEGGMNMNNNNSSSSSSNSGCCTSIKNYFVNFEWSILWRRCVLLLIAVVCAIPASMAPMMLDGGTDDLYPEVWVYYYTTIVNPFLFLAAAIFVRTGWINNAASYSMLVSLGCFAFIHFYRHGEFHRNGNGNGNNNGGNNYNYNYNQPQQYDPYNRNNNNNNNDIFYG